MLRDCPDHKVQVYHWYTRYNVYFTRHLETWSLYFQKYFHPRFDAQRPFPCASNLERYAGAALLQGTVLQTDSALLLGYKSNI